MLNQTEYAQPAVFVVEYALAQLLISWGVRPAALLGYSAGEYVAACLAGVLSLEDALKLVAIRARLIANLPAGAMLAVMASEAQVQPFLREGVELAIVNGPQSCVLAGPPAAIDALAPQLAEHEIACRAVPASHAFHTRMLAPVADELTALVRTLKLHPPAIPYLSNVTGTWIAAEQATDPHYWARHMVETVRFADGVAALLATPEQVLVEIGAGQALSSFVKGHPQCPRARFGQVIATLPGAQERSSERAGLLAALGKLWLADVPIDWSQVHAEERRERLALPAYPFERQRFWIEPAARKAEASTGDLAAVSNEQERKPDIADWFYLPSWKRSSPTSALAPSSAFAERRNWLLLVDECGIGAQLARWLTGHGQTAITVTAGPAFAQHSEHAYTVRPTVRADFEALLEKLEALDLLPQQVIHMWSVTPPASPVETVEAVTPLLERGFYSLLALTQALGNQGLDTCQISVVANELHDVNGTEAICPAKTTLIGICKVLSQEYTGLTGRSIDIVLPANTGDARALAGQLAQEIAGAHQDNIVALRGPHRWVEAFEPVRIEQDQRNLALRNHGVYLITGGLGGLGLALAEELVAKQQARLVLLGRTPLPPRAQWPHILATHDLTSGVGRRVKIVSDLEARDAEVLVLQADVADPMQVRAAVEQTMAHFGALHGVFHTAGVPAVGIIQLKTPEAAAGVLAPKVQGTLALAEALRGLPLDFLVLFSSVAAATSGGPGQADYCAANTFLDAYARSNARTHGKTIAIGWGEWLWDAWHEGLQGFPEEIRAYFVATRQKYGLTFEEGMQVLWRLLGSDLPHVYISNRDLGVMVEGHKRLSPQTTFHGNGEQGQAQPRYPRPALGTLYIPPRNDLEATIATVWEAALGLERIGVDDNFFELGGNSLLGIDLVARLRRKLKLKELPSHILYEAPSVSTFAEQIQQTRQERLVIEEQRDEEFEDQRHQTFELFRHLAEMEDV